MATLVLVVLLVMVVAVVVEELMVVSMGDVRIDIEVTAADLVELGYLLLTSKDDWSESSWRL